MDAEEEKNDERGGDVTEEARGEDPDARELRPGLSARGEDDEPREEVEAERGAAGQMDEPMAN